ncbi:MAG: NUDIX domain-containing protein [Opitutaceae bacterium]
MTNEKVLTISVESVRDALKQGFFAVDASDLIGLLAQQSVFLDRPFAESDTTHKQIIPYAVVTHGERVLLYQRSAKAGESRLHHKFSVGFGGHINDRDSAGQRDTNLILTAMVRELNEEVFLPGIVRIGIVGFINDDSNPVGQVHLGVVFVVELANDRFSVNEPDVIEARWAEPEEIEKALPKLESWSRLLWLQYLAQRAAAGAEG